MEMQIQDTRVRDRVRVRVIDVPGWALALTDVPGWALALTDVPG